MSGVRRCAIIGGGVIGGGWAARLLLSGLDVTVYDPSPHTERSVREMLANAERAQGRLMQAPRPAQGALRFAASVAEAVRDADLVQESAPEREDLKTALLSEIDAHARPDALVCSSTSGLLPSRLQRMMRHPGRFVVGHPFNPVYLLPLVEVCAGAATNPATVERAVAFYAGLGMKPLHVRKEIDGFIADRLLEALWREALWLVHDGVATTTEVDDAIRYGAGLRWSFMGTFLVYRLAGGEAGMRHFMAQFGPALKLPWTKLMDVPDLTDGFIEEIAQQSDLQAGGMGLRALEQKRDDCLVAVMQALRTQDYGAGTLLARWDDRLRAAPHLSGVTAPIDPRHVLRLLEGTVQPDWIDYNDHMTESRYLQLFGESTDALLRMLEVNDIYLSSGFSYYTVETHIMHIKEISGSSRYYTTTQVLSGDDKRIHVFHRIYNAGNDELLATAEQMLLHVDTRHGRACPAKPDMIRRVQALCDAQGGLPLPDAAGRSIGTPGPKGVASPELTRMLDPEVKAFIARTETFYPAAANSAGAAENRAAYDRMCEAFRAPRPEGVSVIDTVLPAARPERQLELRRYGVASARPGVVLLYLHGGGFVLGGLDSHDDICAELCLGAAIDVVSLDYRLAPEHPYPAALDDTEAAYRSFVASGHQVIVGGDSAGGNLAAALCLRLKRLGDAPALGQLLIYPGLGGNPFRCGSRNLDAPLLSMRNSGGYRDAYAGGRAALLQTDPEFAPLSAEDLHGLPGAAIIAAGIDPLRQDAEDYAALLAAAGVPTMFRNDPGLVHGHLRARHTSRAAGRSFRAITQAVSRMADLSFPDFYGVTNLEQAICTESAAKAHRL